MQADRHRNETVQPACCPGLQTAKARRAEARCPARRMLVNARE